MFTLSVDATINDQKGEDVCPRGTVMKCPCAFERILKFKYFLSFFTPPVCNTNSLCGFCGCKAAAEEMGLHGAFESWP